MTSSPPDSGKRGKDWKYSEYEREGSAYQTAVEQGRALQNLTPTPEQRTQIDACLDPDQLLHWMLRSLRAETTEQVFAAKTDSPKT
jgi:hypothetical protein